MSWSGVLVQITLQWTVFLKAYQKRMEQERQKQGKAYLSDPLCKKQPFS